MCMIYDFPLFKLVAWNIWANMFKNNMAENDELVRTENKTYYHQLNLSIQVAGHSLHCSQAQLFTAVPQLLDRLHMAGG